MGKEQIKSKYITLSNKEVKRVVQNELDLRKKTLRKWLRVLTGRKVERLPPRTLETQIEAILKLGASRNERALRVLEKLKKYEVVPTPEIPGHTQSYLEANHCDGTATKFESRDVYISTVPATYLLYHPRAREHLDSAYRVHSMGNPTKKYEEIDFVVKVAIDTLKYDLKSLESKPNNIKSYGSGRGYTKNYDPDPYYIDAPSPSCR